MFQSLQGEFGNWTELEIHAKESIPYVPGLVDLGPRKGIYIVGWFHWASVYRAEVLVRELLWGSVVSLGSCCLNEVVNGNPQRVTLCACSEPPCNSSSKRPSF